MPRSPPQRDRLELAAVHGYDGWRERVEDGYIEHYMTNNEDECEYVGNRPYTSPTFERADVWFNKNNLRHRTRGPAESLYYKDGSSKIVWFCNGKEHNEQGASSISTDSKGVRVVRWCRHGKLHRCDGPALQVYNRDGNLVERKYYLSGHWFDSKHKYKAALRSIGR